MHVDTNTLITTGGALASVALGAGLTGFITSRTAARAEAKADHSALAAQFDAMVHAVADLRAAVEAELVLESSWKEQLRRTLLACMTGLGPAAFVRGSEPRQAAAFAGGAGLFLAQERIRIRRAQAALLPKLAAVASAASPLQRHPETAIQEATDRLVTAIYAFSDTRDSTELESAAHGFGVAVRAVLFPPARRWRR